MRLQLATHASVNTATAAAALLLALAYSPAEAGRAVFTGANDAEPIRAGFRRDSIVLHETGFQIVNGDDPYRDFADHSMGPTGYSDTWPDFFPELDSDIHPEIVAAIDDNDFTLSITLDPASTRLRPHTNRSGERFGVYLQFDHGQVLGGAYLIVGFDGIGGVLEPSAGEREGLAPRKQSTGNRPFALVGQGYWTYYVDERDVTGTAETITLVRRGDVFQLYTASKGSSFVAAAGQRTDRTVHPDVNGTLAVKAEPHQGHWTGAPADRDGVLDRVCRWRVIRRRRCTAQVARGRIGCTAPRHQPGQPSSALGRHPHRRG